MIDRVLFHGVLNERTGYGIHATEFVKQLGVIIPVQCVDLAYGSSNPTSKDVFNISMLDVVTASQHRVRLGSPSVLYTAWESTVYPKEFIKNLDLYDQLWVPSKAQRDWSIEHNGINPDFVKVVPEGVDPDFFRPSERTPEQTKLLLNARIDITRHPSPDTFNFIHVGQWQPRKSTEEICRAFISAFNGNDKIKLYLLADTLFPSDKYKTTEERLDAFGLQSNNIVPVHFTDKVDYLRYLQWSHAFVSCSRSEGWGLPIIEAMACGLPTIVAEFGGSNEYAQNAVRIPITKLIKPFGIYGNWDVPGQWGEPDFEQLKIFMIDIFNNYSDHKKAALKESERIRSEFSWKRAAMVAHGEILSYKPAKAFELKSNPEAGIRALARKHGYEVSGLRKRSVIFTIDCHPSSEARIETLVETINQVKALGFPVLVASHLAVPPTVMELADYFLYDKRDILSGDDKPVYHRTKLDGTMETTVAGIPCHGLAALHNMRNIIDFCLGKWDWIYHINSDAEIDLADWLNVVNASNKEMVVNLWDNNPETFGGQLIASKAECLDVLYPRLETWDEFRKVFGVDRFCSEKGYYKIAKEKIGLEHIEFINLPIGNRFDQVDRDAWKDEEFACNFIGGPNLTIIGMSRREYDVVYSTPDNANAYTVKQKAGMWSRPFTKYYKDWTVKASLNGELKYSHKMNLEGKKVLISLGSKALGDTIAWMPYVEAFREKHGCDVYLTGWWANIFDYPKIKYVNHGDQVEDVYATYEVGCFDNQLDKNMYDWRLTPLQKVASDILGLEYEPLRAVLKHCDSEERMNAKPYVCFSEFSTMQNKFWNRQGAWQNVINWLVDSGFDCVSISAEKSALKNIVNHNGQSIEATISDMRGATLYLGLNHGPSWIAYALNKPCIMITGVSEEWNDFPNKYRIATNVDCKPCFNDISVKIDRSWYWCPKNRNYACTAEITEKMVTDMIDTVLSDLS